MIQANSAVLMTPYKENDTDETSEKQSKEKLLKPVFSAIKIPKNMQNQLLSAAIAAGNRNQRSQQAFIATILSETNANYMGAGAASSS